MKKVIVAIDGLSYSASAVHFAVELSHKDTFLVGVFLDDFSRHNFGVVDLAEHKGSFDSYYRKMAHKEQGERNHSVALFEQICKEAHLPFSIHHDKDIAAEEVALESIYADLLIVDRTQTLSRIEQEPPSMFIKDVLSKVHCPVLLVPPHYHKIEKVVLLFDGHPSSVHAIRTFHQLFPAMAHKEAVLLTVREGGKHPAKEEKLLMNELMEIEFPQAKVVELKGEPEFQITQYLSRQTKETLLVLGAYERSGFSRWVKTSMADVLLTNTDLPLFIAHER